MKIPIEIEIEIDDQLLEDCCHIFKVSRDEFVRRITDSVKGAVVRNNKIMNEFLARLVEEQEILLQNPNALIDLFNEYIEKVRASEKEELKKLLGVY